MSWCLVLKKAMKDFSEPFWNNEPDGGGEWSGRVSKGRPAAAAAEAVGVQEVLITGFARTRAACKCLAALPGAASDSSGGPMGPTQARALVPHQFSTSAHHRQAWLADPIVRQERDRPRERVKERKKNGWTEVARIAVSRFLWNRFYFPPTPIPILLTSTF